MTSKAAPDVRIVVGSEEFGDWKSFDIESDMLQPADAFSFVASNRNGRMAGKIQAMDDVVISIDDDVEMTGFVDTVTYRDGDVQITGRDKFGHLVDCSATPKNYTKIKLDTLATKLGAPWSLVWQVDPTVTLSLHNVVKVDPGDSVLDVLLRMAKKDRVLIWLDAAGIAHIGRPDYDQEASHVIRRYASSDPMHALNDFLSDGAEVTESGQERFSTITVLGSSGNTINRWGKAALQKQSDTDAEVHATRQLILTSGDVKSISQAKQLATDEIERRAFDSVVLKYSVRGFYGEPPSGMAKSKFKIDQRVAVTDEIADIDGVYYMTMRRFQLSPDEGHTTSIELHQGGWLT